LVDAVHAEVADGEGPVGELLGGELLVLGAGGEGADLSGDLEDALAVGVADDGRDEAVGDGDGDGDVGDLVVGDGPVDPGGVDAGDAAQGEGAGLDDEVVEGDLLALGLEGGVDLRAGVGEGPRVEVDGEVVVGDLALGVAEATGDGLAHGADGLD